MTVTYGDDDDDDKMRADGNLMNQQSIQMQFDIVVADTICNMYQHIGGDFMVCVCYIKGIFSGLLQSYLRVCIFFVVAT